MATLHPRAVGKALCDALGLDASCVKRLAFDWAPDNVGTIEVTAYIDQGDVIGMAEVLKRYQLVEKA